MTPSTSRRRPVRRYIQILLAGSCLTLAACESTMLQDVLNSGGGIDTTLSSDTIAAGLKEALTVGTGRVVDNLGARGGFGESKAFRIPLPESLQKARSVASKVGMAGYFDELEDKMNLAAEAATPKARSLFVGAISQLTFTDVMDIYQGGDNAATEYLRGKTAEPLKREMRPLIDSSLAEVGAVSSFNKLVARYNALPMVKDVDADLSGHVLQYANGAIFTELASQESQIRKNPRQRTTALLQQVFGN
ncbi:MAG: DUF4197 domain-containing protein [Pseudomonadales bacterium]